MIDNELHSQLARATKALTVYSVSVVAAGAAMQVIIAFFGNTIGLLSGVLIALIAVGYIVFLFRHGKRLGRVRFGALTAHFVTYLAVNVGFVVHFLILALVGNEAARGQGVIGPEVAALNSGWFGVVVSMPALWGLGLLIHALGAILGRGFEAN